MNVMAENIGFAIPIDRVKKVLKEQLLVQDMNAFLGFELDENAFRITAITPGGPADQAGLRVGDRLTAIDGKSFEAREDYRLKLLAIVPHQPVKLAVARRQQSEEFDLEAWTSVDGYVYERLGLRVEGYRLGKDFAPLLRVTAVQPDSPTAELGLGPGDLIEAVRPKGWTAKRLPGVEDLAVLISRLKPGHVLEFEIWRDDDQDGVYERNDQYSELYRGSLALR
jgi:S1-C subfamily serine protease